MSTKGKGMAVSLFLTFALVTLFSLQGRSQGRPRTQPPLEAIADPSLEYVPGEILIKFAPGAPDEAIRNATRAVGAVRLKMFPSLGVMHWRIGRGLSVERALEILSQPPFQAYIEYAEPNYIVHAIDVFPNDARRGELWGLHNIGQTGGIKDADIDAPGAWTIQQGSPSIVVGVIDTGIDYLHEDLAANIWTNPGEIAGNGIDDDSNGFIDDVRGWDFANDDNDPMDDHGHGTHVAGTIGATGNNGIGVAGVNWTVTLMPLKFLNAGGWGTIADAIDAIVYAASFGVVRVTNNSWGGGRRSKALQDAIASSGALFVAAAGNGGTNQASLPAAYDLENIISVAATDDKDQLASFSNFNSKSVDLGAPGVNILSTWRENQYRFLSGTSMATPHVAGAAALVMAQFPALTNLEVKNRILATVDPNASLQGKTVTGGRLNVVRSLGGTESPSTDTSAPAAVTSLAVDFAATTFESITLSWSAPADAKSDGTTGAAYLYDIRYLATTPLTESNWASATQAQGEPFPQAPGTLQSFTVGNLASQTTYYLGLKGVDEAGNVSPLSNIVAETTPSSASSSWTLEVVDSAGEVGHYNALAYDLVGNPSIAYSDETNGFVKLARRTGSGWQIEVVASGNRGIDHAYDPQDGHPSMAYEAGCKVKFAHWNGTSWVIQLLEKGNACNDVISLAYDPSARPSMSYRVGNGSLKYVRWIGSSWVDETVDPNVGARYSSLAYDRNGNPSIAYSADINNDGWLDTLKFARWNGSSWQIHIVETGVIGFGVFASLAYDFDGNPTIAHSNSQVRFVRGTCSAASCSWQVEVVAGASGGHSLAYDTGGFPWISWRAAGPLYVAHWTWWNWYFEIADQNALGTWRTSLKFDRGGFPSISYDSASDLKYARKQ